MRHFFARRIVVSVALVALTALLAACAQKSSAPPSDGSQSQSDSTSRWTPCPLRHGCAEAREALLPRLDMAPLT